MRFLYLPAIILFVIAGGCKKDRHQPEPQPEKVLWKALPDSVIYITNRNIIASFSDNENLFFLTPDLFYSFDSTGKVSKQASNVPGYHTSFQKATIGKFFRTYINTAGDEITVADNVQYYNHTSTEIRESYLTGNSEGRITQFTTPLKTLNFM